MVPVGDFTDLVDVGHAGVRVAESLDDDSLCVMPETGLHLFEVGRIDEADLYALRGECVGEEVGRTAVEVVGREYMVAVLGNVLQGVCDGGCTGGHSQSGHSTFESRHALFKDSLCRVGQPSVDVARIAQSEAVGSMLGVVEHVGSGLIDGHGARVGCRVGLFLSHM